MHDLGQWQETLTIELTREQQQPLAEWRVAICGVARRQRRKSKLPFPRVTASRETPIKRFHGIRAARKMLIAPIPERILERISPVDLAETLAPSSRRRDAAFPPTPPPSTLITSRCASRE